MYVQSVAYHHGLRKTSDNSYEQTGGGVKTGRGNFKALRVEVIDGDKTSKNPALRSDIAIGVQDRVTHPTSWAFRQLCTKLGCNAGFLQTCDAEDVASIMNKRIQRLPDRLSDQKAQQVRLLEHVNGHRELLAVTSPDFGAVWNHDVIKFVKDSPLLGGWVTPPARPVGNPTPGIARKATKADITNRGVTTSGLQVKVGDWIEPAGLYLSTEDMFILRVNEDRRLDDGSEGGLARGIMIGNSEVGKSRIWGLMFEYREICGNHIVWDAQNVISFRVKHIGRGAHNKAFSRLEKMLIAASNSSGRLDEERINRAKNEILCDVKLTSPTEKAEQVAKYLYGKGYLGLTYKASQRAVALAEEYCPDEKCDPFSVWGVVQGITRLSQQEKNFDKRLLLDAAGGKLLAPFARKKEEVFAAMSN
jgi:hypothetical protein